MDTDIVERLKDELPDCEAPAAGYGQRELQMIERLFRPDMPDGELINLYFLVDDWDMSQGSGVYGDAFRRIEGTLIGRMTGGASEGRQDRDWPGFESEEHQNALEAVCTGLLSHWQLLHMYALSASERGNKDDRAQAQRWQAIMDLCRAQILRRIKSARDSGMSKAESSVGAKQVGGWRLPPGYLTGEFELVESAINSDISHERLMDLLLFADDREEKQHSHRDPLPRKWEDLRDRAGMMLLERMGGDIGLKAGGRWQNAEVDWDFRKFRLALKIIPDISDGELIDLFLQAAENAYLTEGKPMQARWDAVAAQCRGEILQRIMAKAEQPAPLPSEAEDETGSDADDDDDPDDYISMREALKAAENVLRSDMSDEELFDLYVLVKEVGQPETGEVFDEIKDIVSDRVLERMESGTPDPELLRYVEGFDCPDQGEEALKAVIEGKLPHKNLLMLYRLGWDSREPASLWLAIADLCRAQILRRMSPPPIPWENADWQEWSRSELVRRLRLHHPPPIDSDASGDVES